MIISCPACSTRFKLDEALLGAGRTLRCGKCAHQWHQAPLVEEVPPPRAPEGPDVAAPSAKTEEPRAPLRAGREPPGRPPPVLPTRREARSGHAGAWVAWILLMLVIGGAAAAALRWESEIIAAYPKSERLYKLVGLGQFAPGEGLQMENVSSKRQIVDGKRELLVTGKVVSTSHRVVTVPLLKAVLTDAEGTEVSSWLFSATASELGPGESASFEFVARDVPAEAANISVRFSTDAPDPASGTSE